MNELARVPEEPVRAPEYYRPSGALDPNRFAYLMNYAEQMARCGVIPESLRATGSGDKKVDLPFEQVRANCFLVAEVADRWQISPFALLQGASIVYGKLCFEGKIIAGILEGLYQIRLKFEWNGKTGDDLGCRITGIVDGQECVWPPRDSGKEWCTVREWKTTGNGSPWSNPANLQRQMIYRGSREWTRIYKAVLLLGVYADEEMEFEIAAQNARPIASAQERLATATAADTGAGFARENVTRALPDRRQVPMDEVRTQDKVPADTNKQEEKQGSVEGERSDARNGPGEASSQTTKGSEPAAASGAGSDQPSRSQPDGQGGNHEPEFDFKSYSDALMRATQDKSLSSFDSDYRNKNGWTTDEKALPTLRSIYALHKRRIKDRMGLKEVHAELHQLGVLA